MSVPLVADTEHLTLVLMFYTRQKKKRTSTIFPFRSTFNTKLFIVMKYSFLKLEYDVDEYLYHARIQEFSPGGVQVSLTKNSSDNVFFFFFLALSLFYRSQMVNFKEIYHFSRFQRGPTFSRGGGGSNVFQGGSNCLFPIETHITCDFPGGIRIPLSPPLWISTCVPSF